MTFTTNDPRKITEALLAEWASAVKPIEDLCRELSVSPVMGRDLVAHLRSGAFAITLEQAVTVARHVLLLGWRPAYVR